MCAICGVVGSQPVAPEQIRRMTELQRHRGPDDEGVFVAGNVGLGHRRLSILDLSELGHQPMGTRDRNLWITYNGEIYNYVELRQELRQRGYIFESGTDTEVILYAYAEWGPACVRRFNGMWAFAIWNQREGSLFCSRDRLGVKPFYYVFTGETFAFASELKVLLELLPARKVNEKLVYEFLEFGVLDHSDETFFAGIKKLPAAHNLVWWNGTTRLWRYWDFQVSRERRNGRSDADCAQELRELFTDAVRLRLRSDVPVGSCLSGGLDSSAIVCVMERLLSREVSPAKGLKTFSACFEDKRVDERQYIGQVVAQTGADSNLIFPTAQGFLKELPDLIYHQEEPFAGMSIYSQRCVFHTASLERVKVLLDGQGGDELLLGYRKYYLLHYRRLWEERRMLELLREALPFVCSPAVLQSTEFKSGLRYAQGLMDALSLKDFFKGRHGKFRFAEDYFQVIKEDLTRHSVPVLLRYEDKNSMTYAVETRLPFLDYRVVERVSALPLSQKLHRGWTKYVLRQAMQGILPAGVQKRKSKLGFAVPEEEWLRHQCRDVVEAAFLNAYFLPQYVDMDALRRGFDRFLRGRGLLGGSFFFRFFILEHWARAFLH